MAEAAPTKVEARRAPTKKAAAVVKAPKQAAPSPAPRRPLESGARGPVVVAVQERLSSLGLLDGKVNGVYGYATVRAVRRLQGARGLRPSGIIDAATWAALYE